MSSNVINASSCFQVVPNDPQILQKMNSTSDIRTESQMKVECERRLKTTRDPLEQLRLQCLARGTNGIKSFASMNELQKALHNFGVPLASDSDLQNLFARFDRDNSGTIDFDEFLQALRPPMSQSRQAIIMDAFRKLDKTGDGIITAADLESAYSVNKHADYLSGRKTKEEILKEFLKNFEIAGHHDGKVTKEEFMNYYSGLSASVDSDIYFDLMMRNCWKL